MGAFDDLDRDCGAAGDVTSGRVIMVDWAGGPGTPACHNTAILVVRVETDEEGLTTLHGVCGHTVRMAADFPVTDFTPAIATLYDTIVIEEADRLGIGEPPKRATE